MRHEDTCPVCRAMNAKGITGPRRAYLHQLIDLEFMADRVAGMAQDEGITISVEEVEDLMEATCLISDEEEDDEPAPARRLN